MRGEKFTKSRASGIVALIVIILFVQGMIFLFNKEEVRVKVENRTPRTNLSSQGVVNSDTIDRLNLGKGPYQRRGANVSRKKYSKNNWTSYTSRSDSGKLYADNKLYTERPYESHGKRDSFSASPLRHYPESTMYESNRSSRASLPNLQLNSADSSELVTLPGIGPYYARKIIQYRDRLGGFASKEQLMEIFGIDAERFAMFSEMVSVDTNLISRIEIKDATYEQLSKNPYIGGYLARSIIRYRDSRVEEVTDLASLLIASIIKKELYKILKYYIR